MSLLFRGQSAQPSWQYPVQAARPSRNHGVLLINLGTPDEPTPAAVRRYLAEFLADPEVIRLPDAMRWFNGPLAKMIAFFRCRKSAHAYQNIWDDRGSPLKYITEDQVSELQKILPATWKVFYAMRYGNPSIDVALDEIERAEIDELVVIPMYPQFSGPTTRTALTEFYQSLSRRTLSANIRVCNSWYEDSGYIESQSHLVHEFATERGLDPRNSYLLFSTHSMPESYIHRGDPYQEQILRTVDLVVERLGWPRDRFAIAYQSKLGPAKWLSPSTQQSLFDLAAADEKNVIVCPISFTADCLETIEEIGMGYRAEFEADSDRRLHLCPSLNTNKRFIETLRQLALRGPHPVSGAGKGHGKTNEEAVPLFREALAERTRRDRIESLAMVGVCRSGRLNIPKGLSICHLDDVDRFRSIKTSQEVVPDLLKQVQKEFGFTELFLWNTCCRIELYGWFDRQPDDPAEVEMTLLEAARRVFRLTNGELDETLPVNTLTGRDAWRHLLRTASGLNSQLPGETDILEQLEAAHRIASHAGTAHTLTEDVINDVARLHEELRSETRWGRWSESYGAAALRQVANASGLDFDEANICVIGGSTTSRSLLHSLRDSFAVNDKQMSLVYRGTNHGARMKLLRKAIRNGKRIRVNEYTEPQVAKAITDADVLLLGLDRPEPIVRVDDLRDCRDFSARPLTIVDFNTMGSIEVGVESIAGVTVIQAEDIERLVSQHAERLVADREFMDAVVEAEDWLVRQVNGHVDHTNGCCGACHANGNGKSLANGNDRCSNGHTNGNGRHHTSNNNHQTDLTTHGAGHVPACAV